ncbi:MAG: hypothetical protein RLZZ262_2481 [Bacteroidota bacterium]|jgi:hypothetical protein
MRAVVGHICSRVLLFLLFFLLAYFLMAELLHRSMIQGRRLNTHIQSKSARIGGQEHKMLRDFDPLQQYDVFVVGSSHAYRGYDPRLFEVHGYRLFNAGSSSQHPAVSDVLMRSMLPRLKNKPLVIFDLYHRILEIDPTESSIRVIANSLEPEMAFRIMMVKPNVSALNTLVARYLAPDGMIETEPKDYVRDGYCSRDVELQCDLDSLPGAFKINDQAMHGLRNGLEWLTANGYRCVLVSHPMPPQKGRDIFQQGAVEAIQQVNHEFRVPYFDFTTYDFGEQWKSYFWDATHLNQRGVDVFNQLLIDTLCSAGYLSRK